MDPMIDLGIMLRRKPWGTRERCSLDGWLSLNACHTESLAMNTKVLLLQLGGPWLFWESPSLQISQFVSLIRIFFLFPKLPYHWRYLISFLWSPCLTFIDFTVHHSFQHCSAHMCPGFQLLSIYIPVPGLLAPQYDSWIGWFPNLSLVRTQTLQLPPNP